MPHSCPPGPGPAVYASCCLPVAQEEGEVCIPLQKEHLGCSVCPPQGDRTWGAQPERECVNAPGAPACPLLGVVGVCWSRASVGSSGWGCVQDLHSWGGCVLWLASPLVPWPFCTAGCSASYGALLTSPRLPGQGQRGCGLRAWGVSCTRVCQFSCSPTLWAPVS